MRKWIAFGLASFTWLCAVAAQAEPPPGSSSCGVTAKVDVTSPLSLLPGEPLELRLRITNPANTAIQFSTPSAETGSVHVLLSGASTGNSFRRYRGPLWGRLDLEGPAQTLAAGASYDLALRVLHQASGAPFALNTPGPYGIKVSYGDSFTCTSGIEAPIVNVNVVAPAGDDLAVWTAIKDCSGCAFILHAGEVRTTQADQDALTLLRGLVKQYPKSRYTKFIRKQLDVLDGKGKKDKDKSKPHDG